MKKQIAIILSLILLLAAFFRLYRLGSIPTGFINDEAAVGYNAYSLLKTGKDEFGKSWPVFFESFGEGKLPLYVYQALPSVAILGLNEWAVRLPMAILATVTVWLLYIWVRQLNLKDVSKAQCIALATAFMLAVMPWHIHFSRGVFGQESLFWVLLGTIFYFHWVKKRQTSMLLMAMFSWLASMLTYHAPRVFLPPWLFFLFFYHFHKTNKREKFSYMLLSLALLVVPWFYISTSALGGARAAGISIFNQASGVGIRLGYDITESKDQPLWYVRLLHNKVESYVRDIGARYISHFNPQFLFFSGDPVQPRYRVPNIGQIFWIYLPLVVIGLYGLIRRKCWPVLAWLLLSPLPAAVTFDTPSTVRALYMVIPLAIAAGMGTWVTWEQVLGWSRNLKTSFQPLLKMTVIIGFLAASCYLSAYYYDAYFVHLQVRQPYYWQDGYKELVQKVTAVQDQYQRIEITDKRGTPYIYFLFYSLYDPTQWHAQVYTGYEPAKSFNFVAIRKLDNLHFVDEKCPAIRGMEEHVLYVCTQEDIPGNAIEIDRVNYNDDQPAFILLEKRPEAEEFSLSL